MTEQKPIEIKVEADGKKLLDEELAKLFHEMYKEAYNKGFKDGGLKIIETLDQAMLVAKTSYVHPRWLDTARKEIKSW